MPETETDLTTNLIWIDLEMTGLCTQTDSIIEIATIVTDKNLNELAVGPVLALSQTPERMAGMDAWNTKHHGGSGLTDRVLNSDIDAHEAERTTVRFLREWVAEGASPMCGNSICQDRRFLARQMPQLEGANALIPCSSAYSRCSADTACRSAASRAPPPLLS